MEENKALIFFLDDDENVKKREVEILEKNISYVSFLFNNKVTTLPWNRILKIKEDFTDE